MCEYTWLDGTIWICSLMEKPCPFAETFNIMTYV